MTGWGRRSERDRSSVAEILQEVQVPIISNDVCAGHYNNGVITPSSLCSGLQQGGKDSCQGDSGGPAIWVDEEDMGRSYLIGVVSWGNGCGRPENPGVYTRISKYLNWIKSNIGKV